MAIILTLAVILIALFALVLAWALCAIAAQEDDADGTR